MAFNHGSKAVFKVGSSATPAVVVDISAYLTSVSDSLGADTAEVTTLGKGSKVYLAGLKDGTISIEGKFDPTVDAQLAGILAVQDVSFEYGPAGTAVTSPKYTGKLICTSYEVETGVDAEATFSAEFQITDGWTRGAY